MNFAKSQTLKNGVFCITALDHQFQKERQDETRESFDRLRSFGEANWKASSTGTIIVVPAPCPDASIRVPSDLHVRYIFLVPKRSSNNLARRGASVLRP